MSLREQLTDGVRSGDNKKVSNVLDKMTADEVNEKGENGRSALEEAYWYNNIQSMKLLLAKPGIDVNAKLHIGSTILTMACIQDKHKTVTQLLATPGIDLNAKNDHGRTPIVYAAAMCHIKTLEVMLESPHVDLDIKCNRGMGLEDCVGLLRVSDEETLGRKICLDMIREEKLKRMKVSKSEESAQSRNENITKDEHTIDAKDSSDFVSLAKKSSNPATTEEQSVKFARIIFDATDVGKGFKMLRLNAATPMRDIKKLFTKHLGVDEETFMMCFNNQEVKQETPLELFGSNLDGDDNVISIVKTVREDQGAFSDKLESRHPDRETDHALASNDQNGQKEANEVKAAKRVNFKWLGSKVTSQYKQPVRIKPKCIRASCRNVGQHRCDRCKAVFYCQQECLSEDWSHHKVHCDYVYKGSKDYAYEENKDYACEENSVPHDSANEDPEENGNNGGTVEEVD